MLRLRFALAIAAPFAGRLLLACWAAALCVGFGLRFEAPALMAVAALPVIVALDAALVLRRVPVAARVAFEAAAHPDPRLTAAIEAARGAAEAARQAVARVAAMNGDDEAACAAAMAEAQRRLGLGRMAAEQAARIAEQERARIGRIVDEAISAEGR